ncbi:hypothetical protein C8F04DRAFT_1268077 [Mycena alexandri]|uniref:Uncharacterized protein n=1 Tax=Mycena alexandri TaxID=1745969 RepID=A0AAD6WV68_9AGAR|nr:hypothetical protein C8F04DRAFT_1268077 [Mycena alexandri]
MAATENSWHKFLRGLEKNGPTLDQLKGFCRSFKDAHGTRIVMRGTKEDLVYRIVDKLQEFAENGDTDAWEVAYQSWMDQKYARFPDFNRDE